jgi:hypothetical protein
MVSYSVNLPLQLQHEVEQCATSQGISPDQFILWAITEKVATLQYQRFFRSSHSTPKASWHHSSGSGLLELAALINALDRVLSVTQSRALLGQVRWLNQYRLIK